MAGPTDPRRRQPDDERSTWRLTAVAALGLVLLVPPLLRLFDTGGRIFGLPTLAVYLFGVWGVIIALVAAAARKSG